MLSSPFDKIKEFPTSVFGHIPSGELAQGHFFNENSTNKDAFIKNKKVKTVDVDGDYLNQFVRHLL